MASTLTVKDPPVKNLREKDLRVKDLVATLGHLIPLRFAEPWDNVGLLAGDPEQEVHSVLLTIDLTMDVVEEALASGCQMVLCYHPPIFEGLKKIDSRTPVARALRGGLALYAFHTAFDVIDGGVNDALAAALGLRDVEPIRPHRSASQDPSFEAANNLQSKLGLGRVGWLQPSLSAADFLSLVQQKFQVPQFLVAGLPPQDRPVSVGRVAVAAGAGGDLLKTAITLEVDAFVTGEVRHHDALLAQARGIILICLRHSISERHALKPLKNQLADLFPSVFFTLSRSDQDPFDFYSGGTP